MNSPAIDIGAVALFGLKPTQPRRPSFDSPPILAGDVCLLQNESLSAVAVGMPHKQVATLGYVMLDGKDIGILKQGTVNVILGRLIVFDRDDEK